ncbi:cobalt ECF transporter T component CbiQ [Desulfotomaculum copahuensis]|uniref:cobalt ECF transporter T component CbiQ n=1 Tax=Desulfotomaculum copahuensis TaxID=1838280 RepID=UPI0013731687|nr:cobalt ECF transporter T component CbiQ [Desulfotomaculum copahuensis]
MAVDPVAGQVSGACRHAAGRLSTAGRTTGPAVDSREPAGEAGGCNCLRGKLSRAGFVEKTIDEMARVMREEFFAGQIAARPGLLQGIDPRVKVLTTLFLIIVAGLMHHPAALIVFNLWIIWLALVSRVPLRSFLKRVWLVVPLFTGIIVLPSIFNLVRPGDPLLTLFHFGRQFHLGPWVMPETFAITRQGALGALVLVIRVGASVSLAVLLTLTTRWPVLLKTLNIIFVPQIFITVLEMTYRYIYLFLQTASDMFVARKSRTVGRTSSKEQRRFVSGAMGALWNKAYAVSEEVHAAMVSRGYTGRPRALAVFQMRMLDWLWAGFMIAAGVFFLGGDRILGW